MKNDLIRGLKLIRYGISVKGNVICMFLFFVMGLLIEIWQTIQGTPVGESGIVDMSAVFLSCAAMFPAQMVISVDVGILAQCSGYKKKIQTSMPAYLMGAGAFMVLTLTVVIRMIGIAVHPESGMTQMQSILMFTVFEAAIIIFSGMIYKFFIVSVIILYAVMMFFGLMNGFMIAGKNNGFGGLWSGVLTGRPLLCIVVCYAIILAALGVQYGISRLLYKRPLSKLAFGAAMRRYL